ncbi:putative amidohydrolase 2 [Mycobacterium xenopi 4042]|uniref:Putative amidohydrolase 2 n=1 Tax=Mycobacterium xenopi 4042 TaxID=1299334 RepID=X7ZXB9_MYCXE|nr:putative amidohydrolase 2 [Mycobacterium xenopi 4042]
MWEYEGRIYPYIGLNAVAGKKPEEYGIEPVRYDDMIPDVTTPRHGLPTWTSTGCRR